MKCSPLYLRRSLIMHYINQYYIYKITVKLDPQCNVSLPRNDGVLQEHITKFNKIKMHAL
jgi:hypothetical protein